MNLTKKNIESFTYQGPIPRRDVRWDDEVSGFGVRIYPSGKKSFIISLSTAKFIDPLLRQLN